MRKIKEDISRFSGSIGKKAGEIAEVVGDSANQLGAQVVSKKNSMELKRYMPVFIDDIEKDDFQIPYMIRVVDQDSRSKASVCEGAVGFFDIVKGMKVLTLLRDELSRISEERMPVLQPDTNSSFYYKHPVFEDKYQELDTFFDTIQAARVGELREIAEKQKKKKVTLTFIEKKETTSKRKVKLKTEGVKNNNVKSNSKEDSNMDYRVKAEASQKASKEEESLFHIGLDAEFKGSLFPTRPILQYFKGEKLIEGLVEARLNRKNKMKSETLTLKQTKSIGITSEEAAKIDAVLGYFHAGSNLSISNEVKNITNTVWEYKILF